MSETILEEAARATSNDRNKVYGHPRLHFTCTAAMVQAYLVRRGWTPPPEGLLAADWVQIIGLDKTSRQAGNLCATKKLHRDTSVDQAGYARTGEMLDEPEARPTEVMCSRCVRAWEDCECHDGRQPILGRPHVEPALLPPLSWRCARGCDAAVAHYGQACARCAAEAA